MPTNEERREVARKLRYIGEHGGPEWGTAACCIAECIGEDNYPLWGGSSPLFTKLAYLIEPEPERTCSITHAVFNEGDPTGEYEAWNCSHCGELPYDDADSFSYCPCCGAKVIEE